MSEPRLPRPEVLPPLNTPRRRQTSWAYTPAIQVKMEPWYYSSDDACIDTFHDDDAGHSAMVNDAMNSPIECQRLVGLVFRSGVEMLSPADGAVQPHQGAELARDDPAPATGVCDAASSCEAAPTIGALRLQWEDSKMPARLELCHGSWQPSRAIRDVLIWAYTPRSGTIVLCLCHPLG